MRVDFLTCSLTSLSLLFRANSSTSGKLNFSCFDMLQNTFFRDSPVAEDKTCVPSQFTFSAFTFSLSLAARYDPAATVSSLEHWFPIEISIDLHCSFVYSESNKLSAHCLVLPYGTGPADKEDWLGLKSEQERH